jgi:ZIP family zinc transporter
MLYVVVEELLPETTRSGNVDVATVGFVVGFALMMALDQIGG